MSGSFWIHKLFQCFSGFLIESDTLENKATTNKWKRNHTIDFQLLHVCVYFHVHHYALGWHFIETKWWTHHTMVFTAQHHERNLNISKSISVNRFEPFEHHSNDDQLCTNEIYTLAHTYTHTTRPKRLGLNMIIIKKRFSVGVPINFTAKQYSIKKKFSSIVYRAYLRRLCWQRNIVWWLKDVIKEPKVMYLLYESAGVRVCMCVYGVQCSSVPHSLFVDDDLKFTQSLALSQPRKRASPQLNIQFVQYFPITA